MLDLKILASHPVQYQAPLYQELVRSGFEIEVGYYYSGAAIQQNPDREFGLEFAWDINLLDGYRYRFFNQQRVNYSLHEQLLTAPGLVSWALQERQTPLLLIGWFAEVVWLVWLMRILVGAPVMIFGDNTTQFSATRPKIGWRVKLLHWLLRRTRAVFYVGKCNRAFWTSLGVTPDQLYYTPHSVDNLRFAQEVQRLMPYRQELCQHYGIDPKLPVFLFCGKLIPKKRPVQLLEAFLVANLQASAQLLYVGDGELRSKLELRIQETNLARVHLAGFFNQSQMPLAYVLGEILCLVSSEEETWGLVVNEAMACGRPVIVSDSVGCAPDLIGPENGWMITKDSTNSLDQVLLEAFEARGEWGKMGKIGKSKIAKNSFNDMASGIASALNDIRTRTGLKK